jgi:ribose 5-phosphate isomerase A
MLTIDDMKRLAANAALERVCGQPIIGVGSGTTIDVFIELLVAAHLPLEGVVPASNASAARLAAGGIPVLGLADVDGTLPVCVDGADEADGQLRLIKGRGGASTREKVLASAAETFVVIADETKVVRQLGGKPVAVEVLPMAEAFVAKRLAALGGTPVRREGFVTDDYGVILDVTGLPLEYPETLERTLAAIPGVVGNGVFALRPADVLIVAESSGEVRTALSRR